MGHPFLKRIRHSGKVRKGARLSSRPALMNSATVSPVAADTLYENLPALCMALTPAGKVVALNRFGGQLLGVHASGAIGHSAFDWLDDVDVPSFREHLSQCSRNALHISSVTCSFVHRLGRLIQIRGTIRQAPELGGGVLALVGILVGSRTADPTGVLDRYLQQAVNSSTDWACVYNVARRKLAFMGQKLLDSLGYRLEEVQGEAWDRLVHPDDLVALERHLSSCVIRECKSAVVHQPTRGAGGTVGGANSDCDRQQYEWDPSRDGSYLSRRQISSTRFDALTDIEFRIRASNGEWRWWSSQGSGFVAPAGRMSERRVEGFVLGTVRDVTERKLAEILLQDRMKQERVLRGVAEKISESLDLDRILVTTADEVRHLLQADRVAIFRCGVTKGVVVVESRSPNCPHLLNARELEERFDPQTLQQYVRGKVHVSAATHRTEPVAIGNVGADLGSSDIHPLCEIAARLPIQSHAAVPIEQDERLWGFISIQHCSSNWSWQSAEIELLQHLATQVTIAVTQAELYRQTRQQAQREQALNRITRSLRTSLNLKTVFSTAVNLIAAEFQVACASVWQYLPERQAWQAIGAAGESTDVLDLVGKEIDDRGACPPLSELSNEPVVRLSANEARDRGIDPEIIAHLPGQWWVMPLTVNDRRWGCLILGDNRQPSVLSSSNRAVTIVSFIEQLEIAIQQAELYKQVQTSNFDLERKIRSRTYQLRQALELEETLKHITDKVRDSLDEEQILQTAVKELALGLEAECCEAGMYSSDRQEFTIAYEYTTHSASARGRQERSDPNNRIHRALLAEQPVQFCPLDRRDVTHLEQAKSSAILVCPIVDVGGLLGNLWLFRPRACTFGDLEIRIVKQVATQCAIAIRQARLYQAAQMQVEKLKQLNHLKDDFLSTVSHELRTPVTSMRMALQMLGMCLNGQLNLSSELDKPVAEQSRIARYYQILQEECDREIRLVDDLLSLQKLESERDEWDLDRVHLPSALAQLIEPFHERAQALKQVLHAPDLDGLPDMVVDLAAFERVVTELLTNANKYTPEGQDIFVRIDASADTLCLAICNTGVEIPADAIGKVFDKFYRVPKSDPWKRGGTGLGLALVKRLVERLHGHISVRSADSRTTFTVTMPLNQPTSCESLLQYDSL